MCVVLCCVVLCCVVLCCVVLYCVCNISFTTAVSSSSAVICVIKWCVVRRIAGIRATASLGALSHALPDHCKLEYNQREQSLLCKCVPVYNTEVVCRNKLNSPPFVPVLLKTLFSLAKSTFVRFLYLINFLRRWSFKL